MSIALLTQVYDETRRLSIAGSSAAVGDFRLKKLAPPLEQAGQKAPVFAKVAQAITKLTDSNEKTAPEAILDLSTLLNAILYTQGETGASGKLTPIETIDLGAAPTQTTARVLKPLLEALSNTGSGRLEVIKDAHARGVFRDLRLVKPALAALDDPYGEIADFISEQVLPLYGTAILPELRAKFDHKGRGGNVRRLTLMHTLAPSGSRELVKQALEEGSKEVKVAAIECLGDAPEDLKFLLDQAKAKSQDVRRAALNALGKSTSDSAVMVLFQTLEHDDIDLAISPIRATTSSKLKKLVLVAARSQFDALLTTTFKDKAELSKLTQRMLSLLECLRGRTDDDAASFFCRAFEAREGLESLASEPSGKDVLSKLLDLMSEGPTASRKLLANWRPPEESDHLPIVFLAASTVLTPGELFDAFAHYYSNPPNPKKSRSPNSKNKPTTMSLLLAHLIWPSSHPLDRKFQIAGIMEQPLDSRWLDLAVKQADIDVVLNLARPGHTGANELLSKELAARTKKSRNLYDAEEVVRTMIKVDHPLATESVLSLIGMQEKSHQNLYWLFPLIEYLPKDAAPKLEALLTTLPDKVVDQLLDHITELKSKSS
jgi:hypothetical protein